MLLVLVSSWILPYFENIVNFASFSSNTQINTNSTTANKYIGATASHRSNSSHTETFRSTTVKQNRANHKLPPPCEWLDDIYVNRSQSVLGCNSNKCLFHAISSLRGREDDNKSSDNSGYGYLVWQSHRKYQEQAQQSYEFVHNITTEFGIRNTLMAPPIQTDDANECDYKTVDEKFIEILKGAIRGTPGARQFIKSLVPHKPLFVQPVETIPGGALFFKCDGFEYNKAVRALFKLQPPIVSFKEWEERMREDLNSTLSLLQSKPCLGKDFQLIFDHRRGNIIHTNLERCFQKLEETFCREKLVRFAENMIESTRVIVEKKNLLPSPCEWLNDIDLNSSHPLLGCGASKCAFNSISSLRKSKTINNTDTVRYGYLIWRQHVQGKAARQQKRIQQSYEFSQDMAKTFGIRHTLLAPAIHTDDNSQCNYKAIDKNFVDALKKAVKSKQRDENFIDYLEPNQPLFVQPIELLPTKKILFKCNDIDYNKAVQELTNLEPPIVSLKEWEERMRSDLNATISLIRAKPCLQNDFQIMFDHKRGGIIHIDLDRCAQVIRGIFCQEKLVNFTETMIEKTRELISFMPLL